MPSQSLCLGTFIKANDFTFSRHFHLKRVYTSTIKNRMYTKSDLRTDCNPRLETAKNFGEQFQSNYLIKTYDLYFGEY